MRIKFLVIFLCVQSLMVFGQKVLEGTFFGRRPYTTTTFTFSPDSAFHYVGTGCMTRSFGYGIYRLTKKKLLLCFTDSVKKCTITPDTSCKQGEKIRLRFKVMDRETNLPMRHTLLSIMRDSIRAKVWVTDSVGIATLFLDRKDADYFITIDAQGSWQRKFSIAVKGNTCQEVLLRIASGQRYYTDDGAVEEYKIVRHSRRKLILKEKGRKGVYYKWKMRKVEPIKTHA